jgi:hypothetical protein
MAVNLIDIASVIRSKRAGPYELTWTSSSVTATGTKRSPPQRVSTALLISRRYQVPANDIVELVEFEPAAAIKITIRRPRVAGDVGEADVYGAQQHARLLSVVQDIAP